MTLGSLQEQWPRQPNERQLKHIDSIREAIDLLRAVMHQAEGSIDPGEHQEHIWSSKRMAQAGLYLDIVEMFAVKAAQE